ncbi:MAG: hypothetical protein IT291_02130, partial [Deltaproteobacteria bacterium]|nr:hypothetical protein [Deltaproteobacteria bacterium]
MAQAVASATNSAGTLVAAVLEAAGYAQQSRLLVDMQTWFQDMGAFAYVVAAIGAIVSVVLFGSYNMPRYFLLGPALFWFLIGPTRDVSEVTWKLGGGEARSIDGAYMEGLEEYKIGNSENGQEPTKVAAFFYYYTAFFSNLVNSVVDVILKFENDEDLMMIARTQALDMLLNIKPQRKELFEILHQTLYGKCDKMMQYAIALTSRNISDAVVKSLEERLKNTSSDDTEAYQSISKTLEQVKNTRASLQADYDYESFQLVEIDNPMQEFISTHYDKEHKYYGKNILTCGMVWDVAQTAVMEEAAWFVEKVEASHLKPPLDKNNKRHQQLLCYAIAKKLHSNFEDRNHEAGLNGECNLVEAAAIFLMRHTISDTTFSQVAQQIKNKAQVWKGVDDFVWLDDPDTSDSNRGFQLQPGTYMDQQIQHGVLVGRVLPDEYRNLTEEEREGKAREIGSRWRPLMHVEIGGFMDVSYNEQQRYRSLGIMQEIFSYAMHLPYWQGVILYLLGVSYPFLCPLVLLPNRALVILSLPLTWLWVKSWDIGFALVMILDKILWNLLPKSDLPYNPISDDSYSAKLPDMLEQALAVDPSYNLHVHYTFISMAMFAVPAITGYAILKGKSSVLASFTEGAADQGRDANPLAAGSYGAQIMNKRQQQMNEFGGAALLSHGYRGQGV